MLEAQDVVEDQHLAVAVRTGPDADGRNLHGLGDHGGHQSGHALQHDREAAGVGEGLGRVNQVQGGRGVAALHLVSTHGVHRLGRQAYVAHHRDLGSHQRLDHRNATTAALQLDGLCAGPDQHRGVPHRVGDRHVVAHPRHVGDYEGRRVRTGHGRGVVGDVLHRHLQGVLVAEYDHGHRIANEDHVDAGLVDHPGTRSVVCGEHHQGIVPTGHLPVPNGGNRALLSHSWPPSPSSALRLPAVAETVTEGLLAVKGRVTHFTHPSGDVGSAVSQ